MSHYLIREIGATTNVDVLTGTEVVEGEGNGRLERVVLRDSATGGVRRAMAHALFVMIGADPRTGWLPDSLVRDERGYVLTGADVALSSGVWSRNRQPWYAETSWPGVIAVGDVVHDSSKRVAPSVGSGAVAVQMIHRYLAGDDAV